MKIYSFFNSSTSYRVRIALALKGLDYEYHGVNIRIGEQSDQAYTLINSSKSVPALVTEEGEILTQSMAIIDYLDLIYPQHKLIPEDPIERVRVLEVSNVIACDMHAINNLRVLNYLTGDLSISDEQKSRWQKHWIYEGFSAVEALLYKYGSGEKDAGGYCLGKSATLADCCLVPQVSNALRFRCELSEFPKIMKIYEHCQQQPAFKKAAPAVQPDYIA